MFVGVDDIERGLIFQVTLCHDLRVRDQIRNALRSTQKSHIIHGELVPFQISNCLGFDLEIFDCTDLDDLLRKSARRLVENVHDQHPICKQEHYDADCRTDPELFAHGVYPSFIVICRHLK